MVEVRKSISSLYAKYYGSDKKVALNENMALKIGRTPLSVLHREAKIAKLHGWYAMTKEQLIICLDPKTTIEQKTVIADRAIELRYGKRS